MKKLPIKQTGFLLPVLGIIVLLILVGVGGYFLYQKQSTITPQPIRTAPPTVVLPQLASVSIQESTPTASWRTYKSDALNISFKYPPGWFVDAGNGLTYLRVQNYDPKTAPGTSAFNKGDYLVVISNIQYDKKVTTLQELRIEEGKIDKIPDDGYGTRIISNEKEISLNGAEGLYKEVGLSKITQVPGARTVVLDGKGSSIFISQGLDTTNKDFYNQILSTFKFTDQNNTNPSNTFDINSVKAGDKIGSLVVKNVEPFNSGYSPISEKNFKITFQGQVTLRGHYSISDGTEMGIGIKGVGFTPDDNSALLLPQELHTMKFGFIKSFAFSDYEYSFRMLIPFGKTGDKTIIIDNYTLVSYPSEVNNTADLIVIK